MRIISTSNCRRLCLLTVIWLVKLQVAAAINNEFSFFSNKFNKDSLHRHSLTLEYQYLYTTHGTVFRGGSLTLSCTHNDHFFLGPGVEFSHSDFHNDNGWKLYNLNFVPVFIDFKLFFLRNSIVRPFLHTSEGISFNSYKKERDNVPGIFYHMSENGFYVYAGTGIALRLIKHLNPVIELGFKGYHMSFNDLHINPHGLTIRAGINASW